MTPGQGGLTSGAALLAMAGTLRRKMDLTREQREILVRYTAGIGQLGSDALDVRLDGIHALQSLAAESKTYLRPVAEVLSAFVRERTVPDHPHGALRPWDTWSASGRSTDLELPASADQATADTSSDLVRIPDTDVQAALTVLGRLSSDEVSMAEAALRYFFLEKEGRTEAWLEEANLTDIWLSRADLTGARLDGANLAGTRLVWANLTRARLAEANLTEAKLDRANLADAWLAGANLTGACLGYANLTDARLDGANLAGACLGYANLTDARLADANLTEAQLDRANLADAWLADANLTDARLDGANLTGAWLWKANLTGARLDGANLTGVKLWKANLTSARLDGANLTDAWLKGANLTGVKGLTQEQVDVARGDEQTVLPEGITRPVSWTESE
ncbi:pentapeptide repeat-containing protein [Candidatus Frankia alpina]|uniref:Pentapeptide repeat-containing protein n=1 Tax=Candidatus Frankia alpina TaxID=2699483 RepID=A0A4S5CN63_9ACTN|nr:pentapeptide repeat-containing protein [Candidatus Frankia alpina]